MLSGAISRCRGQRCSVREHCLRYTSPPVPDFPAQSWIDSPHTEDYELECGLFMYDLEPGQRAKFFHPGTLGVMLPGELLEVLSNGQVRVRFDTPHPTNNRVIFDVPPNYNPE